MWKAGDEPVSGYRLESFLGEGSNSVVWRATGPGGTATALKLINLSGKLGLKEFRGIQRVKDIRHAHLLPITAVWLLDDEGYVLDDRAMCELDGLAHGQQPVATGTLRVRPRWPKTLVVAMLLADATLFDLFEKYWNQGNAGIPVDELLTYMEDAAKGIDFLNSPRHDLGSGPVAIQHCDIKPQNIVLVGDSAMVCDFGLARIAGGDENLRTLSGPAGTPAYIAPECIRGTQPSSATDQYSLAIAYFELRTGTLPFPGESVTEILDAHVKGQLQLDSLPAAERAVIRKATSLRPEERYPTASKMVRALRRAAGPRSDSTSVVEAPRNSSPPTSSPDGGSPQPDAPAALVAEAEDIEPSDDPRKLVARGTDSLKKGNIDAAIADFDAAIDMDPNLAEAYYGRAMAYGPATEHHRENATALDEQAHSHFAEGDYNHAIADFSEAIRINPELAHVNRCRLLRNRALAYRSQGDCDKAIADYSEVIRRHPDFARAYHDRALAHRTKRDYDQAIADCLEAVRLASDDGSEDYGSVCAASYRERGDAYYGKGEYDRALDDYNEAIRICPQWGLVYNQRGRTYAAQGEFNRAIEDYARSLELDQEFAYLYYYNRGCAYYRSRVYDKAIADLSLAIERRPDYGNAYRSRSRAYGRLGLETEAEADLAKANTLQ